MLAVPVHNLVLSVNTPKFMKINRELCFRLPFFTRTDQYSNRITADAAQICLLIPGATFSLTRERDPEIIEVLPPEAWTLHPGPTTVFPVGTMACHPVTLHSAANHPSAHWRSWLDEANMRASSARMQRPNHVVPKRDLVRPCRQQR